MGTPTSHVQENLSRAYLRSTAADARVLFQWKNDPDFGIDGELKTLDRNPRGNLFASSPPVEFQLKASQNCRVNGGKVIYDLDVDTYNNLIDYHQNVGCVFLILYHMPSAKADWLSWNSDRLILRKCCYYWIPTGPASNNSSTQRIKIPQSNILNVTTLPTLIHQITP